jgi:hypothetical protein
MPEPSGLRRYDYYRGPQPLDDLWTLRRDALTMRCALSTHRQGWELRLTAGTFQRSQVCKLEAEVFSASEEWQQEAMRQGWS